MSWPRFNWATWVVYDALRHSYPFADLRGRTAAPKMVDRLRLLEGAFLECIGVDPRNPWAMLTLIEFLNDADWEIVLALVDEGRDDLAMPEEPEWLFRYKIVQNRKEVV